MTDDAAFDKYIDDLWTAKELFQNEIGGAIWGINEYVQELRRQLEEAKRERDEWDDAYHRAASDWAAAMAENKPMSKPKTTNRPFKCPVCDGTGLVSRPPDVAGDQQSWGGTSAGPWSCRACGGAGIVWRSAPRHSEFEHTERCTTGGCHD